jgi:hypothetical protein
MERRRILSIAIRDDAMERRSSIPSPHSTASTSWMSAAEVTMASVKLNPMAKSSRSAGDASITA